MATDPIAVFEEQLKDEFEGAELWTEEEKMDATPSYIMADYILEGMLIYDQDVTDYLAAIPSWFEFENVFSGHVSVGDVSSWIVSEYCRSESGYLAELIENGF